MKKNDIKISVVIPTYKRTHLLCNCIKALLKQDFNMDEYEIIVVSDGDDVQTKSLLDLMTSLNKKNKIIYLSTNQKKGPAAARNMGWKLAKGQLVLFTDDDCIPCPNWLSSFYNSFKHNEKTFIALTGKIKVPLQNEPTDYEKNLAHLETAEFVTANCAVTKKALEKINGFDEEFTLAWREDSDMHFKLIEANISIIKTEAQITHPARQATWYNSLKEEKKNIFNCLLYKKHPQLYAEKIKAKPPVNYYIMIACLLGFLLSRLFNSSLFIYFFSIWLLVLCNFIFLRLKGTSKKINAVFGIILTSCFIPFLSVYWNFYGAIKFRKLLL